MAPTRILDSHIHLWPSTATTPKDHGWMTPDLFLAKRHGIQDYRTVVQSSNAASSLQGFIYVETDRYLPTKTPEIDPNASKEDTRKILEDWAKAPLDELRFLRRIVEERPEEGDGFKQDDGGLMKGAVVWAPFHLPVSQFETYLELAEEVSGPKLWERVVGFRYLLQGKEKGEVQRLVSSEDWIENIVSLAKGRGGKGWAFDVGVDVNRDGHEPLGAVGEMVKRMRDREAKSGGETEPVRFVLNHLCKHPLTTSSPTDPTKEWLHELTQLSTDQNVFMKLSGAFNEFDSDTPSSPSTVVTSLSTIVSKIFEVFPGRVMFGSDWPVCNVGGPAGEQGNWGLWVESVELLLKEASVGEGEREAVWWRAGSTAYSVEL